MNRPATFPAILRDATSIGIGVAAYGVAFGALCVSVGMQPWHAIALSTLMFTGASQFALVSALAAGANSATAIAAALLLGFRNLAYGVRMNELLGSRGVAKLAAAQLTIDESTAMALAHEVQADGKAGGRWAFWVTGLSVYFWWNLATALGAFGANLASDPKALGLDAAMAAGFLALLWPQLRNRGQWAIALACGIPATLAIAYIPAGYPILLGGLIAGVIAAIRRPA